MRISQIKTLCWASNVLVLAGAGYVGTHFWETYQARGQKAEVEWPAETGPESIQKRWPGEITSFRPIWTTPVNGLVPKPPEPEQGPRVEKKLDEKFLAKHQCSTVLFVSGSPFDSVAYVRATGGKSDVTLRTGEAIDGFTLIGFERTGAGAPVLVFTHPEVEGLVRLERAAQPAPPLFDPPPVQSVTENDLVKPTVTRTRISRHAFQDLLEDPSGLTWFVPTEEIAWWAEYGESEVFSKLVVNVAATEDGTPRGIRLMSQPGQGSAVGSGRGLNQGDIVISVNGVPVRGKEDILGYLHGDGKGLRRYDVVVESESGLQRTVVYKVERRRPRRVSR
jgi:hypothetical protein